MKTNIKIKLMQVYITSTIFLNAITASHAMPPTDDNEDRGDKVIIKRGHYVVDSGRSEKISRILTAGRNVRISVDGEITFLSGTRIHGNNGGDLTVNCTGCVNNEGFISARSINIQSSRTNL